MFKVDGRNSFAYLAKKYLAYKTEFVISYTSIPYLLS